MDQTAPREATLLSARDSFLPLRRVDRHLRAAIAVVYIAETFVRMYEHNYHHLNCEHTIDGPWQAG